MKRRIQKKDLTMKKILLWLTLPILAFGAILTATGLFSSNSYFSKAESEEVKASSTQASVKTSSSSEVKESSSKPSTKPSSSTSSSTVEVVSETEASVADTALQSETNEVAVQEPVVTEVAYSTQAAPVQQQTQYVATGQVLSNGNTAGETGSYAAAQMAAATGVSQAVWESIIARESNGQVNARNASGASGLFQTMPGWGSTATVQDQINAAVNAYNAQGLSAWGY